MRDIVALESYGASLELSMLTGPNAGYVMADRGKGYRWTSKDV
jgi:hypothetical protein